MAKVGAQTAVDFHDQFNACFRFVVEIGNTTMGVFTECTLPTIELDVEEVKEGGLNTSVHLLPGQRKAARLTLKNGVAKSGLLDWYLLILTEKFERRALTIRLLDSTLCNTVMVWNIHNAYPVKWTGPELKSDSNTVAVQSIELACGDIVISV